MKTRKLLLLAAGFMLFAVTAKAQFETPAASYSFEIKNYVAWESPTGLVGLPLDYRIRGDYYYDLYGNRSTFLHEKGRLAFRDSDSYSGTTYGIGDAYLEMRIADHYELRLYRNDMEMNPIYKFRTGFPSYLNVTVQLIKTTHRWQVLVYTDNIMN